MPLSRVEYEQLKAALRTMHGVEMGRPSIGIPHDTYLPQRNVIALIARYTEEFAEEVTGD